VHQAAAITGRHWTQSAEPNGLDPGRIIARVDELAGRLPAAFRSAAAEQDVAALGSGLPVCSPIE
jgi:hypothetical protein